jgi:hypothetical protein
LFDDSTRPFPGSLSEIRARPHLAMAPSRTTGASTSGTPDVGPLPDSRHAGRRRAETSQTDPRSPPRRATLRSLGLTIGDRPHRVPNVIVETLGRDGPAALTCPKLHGSRPTAGARRNTVAKTQRYGLEADDGSRVCCPHRRHQGPRPAGPRPAASRLPILPATPPRVARLPEPHMTTRGATARRRARTWPGSAPHRSLSAAPATPGGPPGLRRGRPVRVSARLPGCNPIKPPKVCAPSTTLVLSKNPASSRSGRPRPTEGPGAARSLSPLKGRE